MAAARTCPDCGAEIPCATPPGLCEACLLRLSSQPAEPLRTSAPASKSTISPSLWLTEKPGDRIGRYKLLEQLGEGGCGVVYMAEQSEPVRRRVALKVIKLGMDTRQVVARFEAERQALALMDHPNIAKVFDAGGTEAGRPFFVMELVRGIPITRYCDDRKLDTNGRLELFVQVCQAIQHAHQKGIIHRDIKPSNILVGDHDGVAVPKVIDFGIAKATTDQRLTDKTLYTAVEQFVGTPAYMSPEQAELSGLDIDTRSDIYSLGVLLYELLTGKTPFDSRRLVEAGLDEIRRIIREEDPPRPSTRLSTLEAAERTAVATRRDSEPAKLSGLIRGDLDWIAVKTLEKDRNRRYETANGLAMDVQRFLTNEPVLARPPSGFYRFRKLVWRNKLGFAAGSAVAASLVLGLTLALVFFLRAREQAAIAKAVNEFLQDDLLRQAGSREQAQAKFAPDPNLTVRQALERAAERIGDRFKDRPLVEAAIQSAIGDGFAGLGEAERTLPHYQRAAELRRARLGAEHPETLDSMSHVALAYQYAGKLDQALPLFEETCKLMKTRLGANHPATLSSMNNLAGAYKAAGKLDQALPLYEETLKLRRARLGPDHQDTLLSMNDLALAYEAAGKLDQALRLNEETLRLMRTKLGLDHQDTLGSMNNLAVAYRAAGKIDQALPLFEETCKLMKTRLGPDHPATLTSMNNLAMAYHDANKLDRAVPLLEETLKLRRTKLGLDHPATLTSMNNLASVYQDAGKLDQALPLFEETCKLMKTKLGPDHPATLVSMGNLARAYRDAGKLDQALPLLEETVKMMRTRLGPDHPYTLTAMHNLAMAYKEAGKLDQALPLFQEVLKLRTTKLGPDHPDTLSSMAASASAMLSQSNYAQAQPLLSQCLELRQTRTPDDWATFSVRSLLGMALLGQNRFKEAEPLLVQGYTGLKERDKTIPSGSKKQIKEAGERLVQLYEAWDKPGQASEWRSKLDTDGRR